MLELMPCTGANTHSVSLDARKSGSSGESTGSLEKKKEEEMMKVCFISMVTNYPVLGLLES